MSRVKRDAANTAKWILNLDVPPKTTEMDRVQMYAILVRREDMISKNFLFVVSGSECDYSMLKSEFSKCKNVTILRTDPHKVIEQVQETLRTSQKEIHVIVYMYCCVGYEGICRIFVARGDTPTYGPHSMNAVIGHILHHDTSK